MSASVNCDCSRRKNPSNGSAMKMTVNASCWRGVVSRPEVDALKAERRVPSFAPKLTIGGGIEQSVHALETRRREIRIGVIENRLTEITSHAVNTFSTAQLQSRACRDFERSR